MDYTYTSLLTTVLFCNFVLIVIAFILKKTEHVQKYGYTLMVTLIIATTIRLALPFEILPISHNVIIPDAIAKYITIIVEPIGNTGFSIEHVLLIVWGIGIILKLALLIIDGILFCRCVCKKTEDITNWGEIKRIIEKYTTREATRIKVYRTSYVSSPLLCGLIQQRVLLPIDAKYDAGDLEYILCHELTHYNRGDLYLKLMVSLLNCIFWWNPGTVVIRNQLNTLLEIRADDAVVQKTGDGIGYMTALLNAAKEETNIGITPIMSFSSGKSELKMRFEYIMAEKEKPKGRGVFASFMVILFILSYVFILEPSYVPQEVLDEEGAFVLTKDNAYLVDNGDGTYDVYYQGEYFYTESELKWGVERLEVRENKTIN